MHGGHDYIREYLIYLYILFVLQERTGNWEFAFDGVTENMLANWKKCNSPYKSLVSYADAIGGHYFLTSRDYPKNIVTEATDMVSEYYMTRSGSYWPY